MRFFLFLFLAFFLVGCGYVDVDVPFVDHEKKLDDDDCEPDPDPEPPEPDPNPPGDDDDDDDTCQPQPFADAWDKDYEPRARWWGIIIGTPPKEGHSYMWRGPRGRIISGYPMVRVRPLRTVTYTLFAKTVCGEAVDSVTVRGLYWLDQDYREFKQGARSFMPENHLHEFDTMETKGVTEQEFYQAIEEIKELYSPIVRKFGAKLDVAGDWSDSTVNAYAQQSPDRKIWYVRMFGGLARRPEINKDSFLGVLAHEMAHHLGGFPLWTNDPGKGAAAEVQSDYVAVHAVLRKLWENDDNSLFRELIPEYPKAKCDKAYYCLPKRQELCYRTVMAGKGLADLLAALGGEQIAYDTPDPTVVDRTQTSHPNAQCRLDTYLAGAQCRLPWKDSVIPKTEVESYNYLCKNGEASRPNCWFKASL